MLYPVYHIVHFASEIVSKSLLAEVQMTLESVTCLHHSTFQVTFPSFLLDYLGYAGQPASCWVRTTMPADQYLRHHMKLQVTCCSNGRH